MEQCQNCGSSLKPGTSRCAKCGTQFAPPPPPQFQPQPPYQQPAAPFPPQAHTPQQYYGAPPGYPQQPPMMQHMYAAAPGGPLKSKFVAVVLALLLGPLGIHNFYLGRNAIAICQLLISICTCGWGAFFVILPWIFVEAIMIFTGSLKDGLGRPLQ